MFAYIFQISLVIVVVALSVGYALWRIRKSVKANSDPCAGCTGCALRNQKKGKEACEKKKNMKKNLDN